VAGILADLGLDTASVVTGLLHDVVEDNEDISLEDIKKRFGSEIMELVDGVTKLSQMKVDDKQIAQAENFQKFLLAIIKDVRVLIVKLADRLHNMRTLHFVAKPEKRRRKALETLEIYAPLGDIVGLKKIERELHDLAFKEVYPEEYKSIVERLDAMRVEGGDIFENIQNELTDVLQAANIPAKIDGREKSPYSIWRKMQRKNVDFEQLSDIMAFRVIVPDPEWRCYEAFAQIHTRYHAVPGRVKDYISTPKQNGYQSLHTTVIGPHNKRIEIQIRTQSMHEVAEKGEIVAHALYKSGDTSKKDWRSSLLEISKYVENSKELVEHAKMELFPDEVFCTTPKGQIIHLPRGATPVDFAYAIHGDVGDCCVGAKINGRMVPLSTEIMNTDQVEIITQKNGTPSPNWEKFVITGKAKARIRKFVRTQQRPQNIILGRALLEKICKQNGVEFGDKLFEPLADQFQSESLEDLYANIGASIQSPREVMLAIYPQLRNKNPEKTSEEIITQVAAANKAKPREGEVPLLLKGLIPGMSVHFARCCHPLPGDSIVGIVATGRGVTVHTQDCKTLETFRDQPERWIDVDWGDKGQANKLTGRLAVVIANRPNSLGALTTGIGKAGGNILNFKITNRTLDFFEILVDVEVKDSEHLSTIMASLRANQDISSVDRQKGQ